MNRRAEFRVLFASLWGFACCVILGCGDQSKFTTHPVHGEVFVDGQPATGAEVHFHPVEKEAPPAVGTVDDEGGFDLTTYSTSDGAAAGDYIVTINWRDERPGDGEIIVGPDRLGERYSKRNVSKLTATVSDGETIVDRFDLKSK
jgi:hypothetical protein